MASTGAPAFPVHFAAALIGESKRSTLPEDSSLVARTIGSMRFVTCATPAYLALHGTPGTIEELDPHRSVVHLSGRTGRPFDWEFIVQGRIVKRHVRGTIAVNDADAYVACGLQGIGIIQTAKYMVSEHLASGALVEVLADYPSAPMPISMVYPKGRLATPKLRVFAQWIEALFAAEPFLALAGHSFGGNGQGFRSDSDPVLWANVRDMAGEQDLGQ